MTCDEIERDEVVEQYLLGRLDAGEQARFEDHYFDCARCLERLRVLEESRTELARQKAPARWGWRGAAAGLAAAAALVLAIRVGHDVWTGDRDAGAPASKGVDITLPPLRDAQAEARTRLGQIDLPSYTPPRLRSASTEAQRIFRDAMTSYATRDCGAAVAGLQRALTMDDSLIQARFYLAACQLHTGQVPDAISHLERIVAAGESPYLEDARFFLAKGRIRQGDIEGARQELGRVVALGGDRRDEAQRLLDELR